MGSIAPPTGYASWLDYAIDTMDTRSEYLDRLWRGENLSRADIRDMAKSELARLRNGSPNNCDGCEHLTGRHCTLSVNHCTRRAEDYYKATGGEG